MLQQNRVVLMMSYRGDQWIDETERWRHHESTAISVHQGALVANRSTNGPTVQEVRGSQIGLYADSDVMHFEDVYTIQGTIIPHVCCENKNSFKFIHSKCCFRADCTK